MKLSQPAGRIVVPEGVSESDALARTTHLGVGAHPDDLEIMTWHAISTCFGASDRWFTGLVVADGASSPRGGRYARHTDEEMRGVRWEEQKKAAVVGDYGALVYLGFSSPAVRSRDDAELDADLDASLRATRPEVVFTHNPCDAHDTHVAVAMRVIRAVRALPDAERPAALYGCEVWRSLDWLPEPDRVRFDVSGSEELGGALVAVYDSQIAGGKRYDVAALARRRQNATFGDPRAVDRASATELVMDLTPLVRDPALDVHDFVMAIVDRFSRDVSARMRRFG
jgi:LmbE family N-acetylglucosaminyl deacetylase